jgi:hypothetical protein
MALLTAIQRLIQEIGIFCLGFLALYDPAIGLLIRRIRGGIPREEFAKMVGASTRSLDRWERGYLPGARHAALIMRLDYPTRKKEIDAFTKKYLARDLRKWRDEPIDRRFLLKKEDGTYWELRYKMTLNEKEENNQ